LSNLMCIGIWVSYATTFGCGAGDTSKRIKQFQWSCGFDTGNVKRLNLWQEQIWYEISLITWINGFTCRDVHEATNIWCSWWISLTRTH
jgi:hypothetical protein